MLIIQLKVAYRHSLVVKHWFDCHDSEDKQTHFRATNYLVPQTSCCCRYCCWDGSNRRSEQLFSEVFWLLDSKGFPGNQNLATFSHSLTLQLPFSSSVTIWDNSQFDPYSQMSYFSSGIRVANWCTPKPPWVSECAVKTQQNLTGLISWGDEWLVSETSSLSGTEWRFGNQNRRHIVRIFLLTRWAF